MNSRQHRPNEYERQPCCSRFGFRSRLQTIMEVDSSATRSPGGRERGVKRPLTEMIGQPANNTNDMMSSRVPKMPARRSAAVKVGPSVQQQKQQEEQNVSNCRPAKRTSRSCVLATPKSAHDVQKRSKAEPSTACQTDHQKKNMKSSLVAPSGGGVPKLTRNQVKPVTDDQRAMHKQLQNEHLQLQRSFALWRQLVEEAKSHQDNEELASWAEEKEGILKSTKTLQNKVDELQEKLTEYREQNELLEFRILELDHCQTKQCPPCGETMTSPQPGFCTTGCTQPDHPCFRLFQDQVNLYQDLEFRADELLEELRLLSALPGLSCGHRSALARSAACVLRCKGEARTTIGLLAPQPEQETTPDQAQFLGSEWLGKILFGRSGLRSGSDKGMDEDDADLSDQSLLQETSMTESEIGQALISEWSQSHPKTTEQHHSEDEGLGEDSRRSTEPNSLVSEDPDAKTLQTLVEDLRRKNSTLRNELRQAEVLVRTLKVQADRVQDLENQLTRTEKERSEYQEQILELEEAENDARLESQTLRALVENLRQHEDDLQKSLCATRDRLEECEQRASAAGTTAEELRSQVGYLEELVYKYEEHIEGLERAESILHRKLLETKKECMDAQVQVDQPQKEVTDVSVQVNVDDTLCRCPQKKDLLARLQSLEEKDGVLREQLHQVDGINLKLWQKLYCLETDIGECKRQERSWEPEQHHREAAARLEGLLGGCSTSINNNNISVSSSKEVGDSEEEIGERLLTLECNEKKLREQLLQLERINQDFERELEIRERLNRDREREQSQWVDRERELKGAITDLENERISLREQTLQLEEERSNLRDSLEQLQEEYGRLKLAHCQETQDLHIRHQEASQGFQDTRGQEEEDFQKVMKLSQEALQLKSEQEELRSQVAEMSLAFETELRALRACHELEEKRLHDEMMTLRCRDDQCCSRVQELAAQRERLESVLAEREQQLETLTEEFQKKTHAMDEERRLVENELQKKMREMEESTANAVQELEEKRKQLETSLRADMEDLRCKENSYKLRIRDLERHVDSLRHEIMSLAQGVGSEDYGPESEEHQEYRHRIEELEKKEAAYVETLQNADKIISQMELRYRDNIQRLEGSERSLQERIVQLETTEVELRSALHNERRSSDSGRITELVRDLMEAESRENSLKEHADELEASHKAMLLRVRELEKLNQQISEELGDHEDASLAAVDLRLERERLKEEIGQLKRSEAALQETLAHADVILGQRERILEARVNELEAEKQDSDEMVKQLREQVKTMQEQLDQAQLRQAPPSPRENADTEVSKEEISDLKLEVRRLQQCLSATQAHLDDLDSVRRNQERVIEQLEEDKIEAEDRIRQLHRVAKGRDDGDLHTGKELQKRVLELEKLIRRSSWSCAETKQTQTERSYYCSSRSATVPVSPASSLEDLSAYPDVGTADKQEEEVMIRRKDDLEDASCLGIEERMELELCMKRAMAAMERDLQRKNEPHQKPQLRGRLHPVYRRSEEDEDEDEEDERIRMPPSPACSSTSGCESDCSSSGGSSCRWPDTMSQSVHPTGQVDSDEEQPHIERLTVTSKELPTLMKTRIIYPSITKTEVKEMPTLVTRHSEYPADDSVLDDEHSSPEAPSDFCILRRVGRDSLLLGWTPPTSSVSSYQILVDGEVHQRVRSPDRTKALLHKLDLTRPLTIAIRSLVTADSPSLDLLSQQTLLSFQPTECHKQ